MTPEKVLRALEKQEINAEPLGLGNRLVIMPNIKLSQPKTLDEAVSFLAKESDQTKIIAGGTALVIMLRNRLISPSILLSLGRLPDLRYIRHEPGSGSENRRFGYHP